MEVIGCRVGGVGTTCHFVRQLFCSLPRALVFSTKLFQPQRFILPGQMAWPLDVRVRAVQLFWQLGSAAHARRALARELDQRELPHAFLTARWAGAFGETGSVQTRPRRRQPHRLTPSTLRCLCHAIRRSPRLSLRRLSTRMGIPLTTVHRAISHLLGLFP